MIRHPHGHEFFLFTQNNHARLSGFLAEHFGNRRFARPEPRTPVIDAVAYHDAGWSLHDHQPTLNPAGMPMHVFETPIELAVRIWTESVRLAQEVDPYTGFLVSLHVFSLSAHNYQHHTDPAEKRKHAKELFLVNKFQQLQIEIQERFRAARGLRTDMPLELGLAPYGHGEIESQLRFNYQILRTLDQISLALLCGGRPITTIDDIAPRPSVEPISYKLDYEAEWTVSLTPWPFDVAQFETAVSFRRVPAEPFASEEEFQATYAEAKDEKQMIKLVRAS